MIRLARFVLLMGLLATSVASCGRQPDLPVLKSGPKLETREDGKAYEPGSDSPFTGTSRRVDKMSGKVTAETQYEAGRKHGWERRWFAENLDQMSRQTLWVQGEPVFFWLWWPNGQLKELSSQRSGKDFNRENIAYGSYVTWFEDGRIKFKVHFDEKFRWHGPALDYDDQGRLIWDAVFEHGIYKSGTKPSEASHGPKSVTPPSSRAAETPDSDQ